MTLGERPGADGDLIHSKLVSISSDANNRAAILSACRTRPSFRTEHDFMDLDRRPLLILLTTH